MVNHHHIRGASKLGRRYSLRPSPATHRLMAHRHLPGGAPVPTFVDLRKWHPGIRDQGQEGSCSGFETAAFREVLHGSAAGQVLGLRLSPAYLYARTRIAERTFPQDSGCTIADEMSTLQAFGVCPEDDLPYNQDPSQSPTPVCDAAAVPFRIGQPAWVDAKAKSIKSVLAAGLPIEIGMPVYQSFETPGPGGVLSLPDTSTEALLGGHALLVVGYDDASSSWTIANSWGTGWGDGGFCHAPYGYESLWWEAWTAPAAP